MNYRVLGRTERKVSEIGMGTEHLLDKDERVVTATIKAALDGGVTYFDCHPGHDKKEGSIYYEGYVKLGKAIHGVRDKLCLTYLAPSDMSPADTQPRYEDFLRSLGTDYIDVFIIQFCDRLEGFERASAADGLLDYAISLKAEGKIKYIGISTHSLAVAYKAIDNGAFDVIMYPVNPAFDVVTDEEQYKTDNLESLWDAAHDFTAGDVTGARPRRSLYNECERKGVAIVAMKPFAGGFIFNVEKDAGFTPVNLIAYALAQNGVSVVAPGCTRPEEMEEILTYYFRGADARDYGAAVAKSRWSVMENCQYCNHCLPCTAGINIGLVNRLLDKTDYGTQSDISDARAQYIAMSAKASECVKCGDCVTRCPFKVKVIDRMQRAAEIFE